MRVNAFKITKILDFIIIPALTFWLGLFVFINSTAAAENVKGSWDQWLDNAYQLTWHDQVDIKKWIAENEISVFDKKLIDFTKEWEIRLNATPENEASHVFPDKAFRQLAIAQMLVYLSTSDIEYLKKAVTTMNSETLKAKLELPDIAFWYYYIRAHYYMEQGNADRFVRDVYLLWLDVILKLESAKYEIGQASSVGALHGLYRSIPYLYRNMANLILQRAIVSHKMSGIDGLGVIVWNLSPRMPSKGYGKWVEQVAKRMNGPESDNFRLTFTVQYMEAEKKRLIIENLFDAGKDPSKIEQRLVDILAHYEMLYGLANTLHGRATTLSKQLQLTSFVLSRLYEPGPHQAVLTGIPMLKRKEGKAWHEQKDALTQAIKIFDELAENSGRPHILIKNGFLTRKTYVTALQDLWRSIMNLCLDTAIYYERFIEPNNAKSLRANIPLIDKALVCYLDFFARYVNKGYQDVVPDNAFYGAFEASELLSEMHFLSAPWEKGMKKYDLALARRIQALEIFPFDVKNYYLTAHRLSELGRLEKYKRYVQMLAYRIRKSELIRASAVQKQKYLGDDLLKLQAILPEIIMRAPYNIVLEKGLKQVPQELSKRADLIEKETGKKIKGGGQTANAYKKIAVLAGQLKQRLAAKKTFSNEEIFTILKDVDPLVALINANLQSTSTQDSVDEIQPFSLDLFPSDLKQLALELNQIKEECRLLAKLPDLSKLRDTLVFEVNHPFHTLLRRFYYENSLQDLNYLRLLRGQAPNPPSALGEKPSKGISLKDRD